MHHNPTPGPSGSEFLYGHVLVTISWLVKHPQWGCIGMPLLALMYVRQKDLQILERIGKAPWKFRTKLELAGNAGFAARIFIAFVVGTMWGWSSPAFGAAARERWSERSSGVRHGSVRRQLRDYVVGRREKRLTRGHSRRRCSRFLACQLRTSRKQSGA
jgi:hypothetical protein